jgi:DNA-binding transcriptional regulator LsrR (DeoR family)
VCSSDLVRRIRALVRALSEHAVSRHYWEVLRCPRSYYAVAQALLGKQLDGLSDLDDKLRRLVRKEISNEIGLKLRRHEIAGSVSHYVAPAGAAKEYFQLLPVTEDILREHFKLRDVVVVDISKLKVPSGSPVDNAQAWNHYDDQIHQVLGVWAARILGTVLRVGDVLGVGGGRGPHYTAEHAASISIARDRPKQIVSLTGNIDAHFWRKQSRTSRGSSPKTVDADVIAMKFYHELGALKPPRFFGDSITAKKLVRAQDVTVGIVGIGALGGGHRLMRHSPKEADDRLDEVEKELNQLVHLVGRLDQPSRKPPFLHWVGDICNRLFVVSELRGRECPKAERKKLADAVNGVNKRFASPSIDDLSRICDEGTVIAIAGGPHKAAAIRHVLCQAPRHWITHLITDHFTADELLKDVIGLANDSDAQL